MKTKFEQLKSIARKAVITSAVAAGSIGGLAKAQQPTEAKQKEEKPRVETPQRTPEENELYELKRIEAETTRKLAEIRAKITLAIEERKLHNIGNITDTSKIGVANRNEAVNTVTHREVDILDANGNKIGTAMEGSKEWAKLEEKRIKANKEIEKERAKSSRNVIVERSERYPGDRTIRRNDESTMGGANKPWDRRY